MPTASRSCGCCCESSGRPNCSSSSAPAWRNAIRVDVAANAVIASQTSESGAAPEMSRSASAMIRHWRTWRSTRATGLPMASAASEAPAGAEAACSSERTADSICVACSGCAIHSSSLARASKAPAARASIAASERRK